MSIGPSSWPCPDQKSFSSVVVSMHRSSLIFTFDGACAVFPFAPSFHVIRHLSLSLTSVCPCVLPGFFGGRMTSASLDLRLQVLSVRLSVGRRCVGKLHLRSTVLYCTTTPGFPHDVWVDR